MDNQQLDHIWIMAAKQVLSRVDSLLEVWTGEDDPDTDWQKLKPRMIELNAAMDVFGEIDSGMNGGDIEVN